MGSGDHLKKGGGGGPGRRVAEGNEVGRVRVFLQTKVVGHREERCVPPVVEGGVCVVIEH
jgi:hypothetical protein